MGRYRRDPVEPVHAIGLARRSTVGDGTGMSGIPPLDWSDVEGLTAVVAALDPNGTGCVRLVGGCVRDRLLGLPVADFDCATTLSPQAVITALESSGLKAIPTGLAHGTVTAVSSGKHFEVTTLRHDVTTDGRHATVAFTDDWAEDAKRRDFTINALYSDPRTGEVFDPVGGLPDLAPPYVRFIGDAGTRIREDYLRILRYFRFFARFGGANPDGEAMAACAFHAKALMTLSRERVAQELLRIFGAADPTFALRAMADIHLFDSFMPEFIAGSEDAIAALVLNERRLGLPPAALRRLSAALPVDERAIKSFATRMKFSKQATQNLTTVAAARTMMSDTHCADLKPLIYAFGKAETLDAWIIDRGSTITINEWHELTAWPVPVFPIKGRDLIERGIAPGPMVSETLKTLEREWIESGFPSGAALHALLDNSLHN